LFTSDKKGNEMRLLTAIIAIALLAGCGGDTTPPTPTVINAGPAYGIKDKRIITADEMRASKKLEGEASIGILIEHINEELRRIGQARISRIKLSAKDARIVVRYFALMGFQARSEVSGDGYFDLTITYEE
jgi:hypothetical protein